jgi:hypothetical protein
VCPPTVWPWPDEVHTGALDYGVAGTSLQSICPDEVPLRIELDEVVGASLTVYLALVFGLVVHRLAGVVGDVGDPVGLEVLRDARTVREVGTSLFLLLVDLSGVGNGGVAV